MKNPNPSYMALSIIVVKYLHKKKALEGNNEFKLKENDFLSLSKLLSETYRMKITPDEISDCDSIDGLIDCIYSKIESK